MKTLNIFEKQVTIENSGKDWRHAFKEEYPKWEIELIEYSCADVIKIKRCGICGLMKSLLGYVIQFDSGGFWYNEAVGLHFVTEGVKSDEEATYEDAKLFIKTWKEKQGD